MMRMTARVLIAAMLLHPGMAVAADDDPAWEPLLLINPPKLLGCDWGNPMLFQQNAECSAEHAEMMAADSYEQGRTWAEENLLEPLEKQAAMLETFSIPAVEECLGDKGVSLSSLTGDMASNPAQFAQEKFKAIWGQAMQSSAGVVADLPTLTQGNPAAIAQRIDQAFVDLAATDPIGECLVELLPQNRAAIRSIAVQVYSHIASEFEEYRDEVIVPAVHQALVTRLGGSLNAFVGNPTLGGSAPPRLGAPKKRKIDPGRELRKPEPRMRRPSDGVSPRSPVLEKRGSSTELKKRAAPSRRDVPQTDDAQRRELAQRRALPRDDSRKAEAKSGATSAGMGSGSAGTMGAMAIASSAGGDPEGTRSDVEKIALGVAYGQLLHPERMAALSSALDDLSAALSTDPGAVGEAYAAFEDAIEPMKSWDDRLALQVGVETIRFYGHGVVDDVVGEVLTAIAQTIKDVIKGVVDWVGSLGWAVVEAVVDIIATIVEALINWILMPASEALVKKGAHAAYDQVVDAAYEAMKNGQPPSAVVAANAGPLAPLLATFPTENDLVEMAMPRLAEMRQTLESYHLAVEKLAHSAVQEKGK